ncbi:hypothetical protein PR048_015280 [Dryococelus australis]|uniref:Uncharacterized protein n=1 Tax=Dryococelus australis TaxID=614101 RepID=A0ABQ9HGG9_9NEOP|nr:hypothetical protein PR048_015280 [Dryococelus australis]
MPLVSRFSQRSPLPPPFHSHAAPYSPHFTLIDSQDFDVKSLEKHSNTDDKVPTLIKLSRPKRKPSSWLPCTQGCLWPSAVPLGTGWVLAKSIIHAPTLSCYTTKTHFMALEVRRLFELGADLMQSLDKPLPDVIATSKEQGHCGHDLLPRLHLLQVLDRYLLVEVVPGGNLLHLGLEEGACAHLDVHDVGVSEAMQQVLQLDELLSAVLDLAEVARHDVPGERVGAHHLVHFPLGVLRPTATLLPDGAWAGGREAIRVSRQLEPRVLSILQQDVARRSCQVQCVLKHIATSRLPSPSRQHTSCWRRGVSTVPHDGAGQRVFSRVFHFPRLCILISLHPHRLSRPRYTSQKDRNLLTCGGRRGRKREQRGKEETHQREELEEGAILVTGRRRRLLGALGGGPGAAPPPLERADGGMGGGGGVAPAMGAPKLAQVQPLLARLRTQATRPPLSTSTTIPHPTLLRFMVTTSNISQLLLKIYFRDIPPPHAPSSKRYFVCTEPYKCASGKIDQGTSMERSSRLYTRKALNLREIPHQLAFMLLSVVTLSFHGGGENGRSRENRRPAAWAGVIPTCENPGVTRPGIEPDSPWWEASILTSHPPRPLTETAKAYRTLRKCVMLKHETIGLP